MSDRVAYFAGNTIGRDHLNWPTILRSEIAGLFPGITDEEKDNKWPVDVTLAQILALVWRVKKWRLTGNCEADLVYSDSPTAIVINGTSEFDADQFIQVLTDGDVAATRESDLVKRVFVAPYKALVNEGVGSISGTSPIASWEIDGTLDTGGGPSPFSDSNSTDVSGALDLRFVGGFHLFDSGMFSPPFESLIGNMVNGPAGINGPGFLVNVKPNRNPETVLSGTGPLLLKAPGTLTIKPLITADIVVPLEISWRLPSEAVGSTITGTASADLTLEAVEFWPYKNSENLPVWNSATGAQLRSPFS